jgi:hypothetical protein
MTTQTQGPQKLEWQQGQYPSVYSNIASVSFSPFDISILYGEVDTATLDTISAKPLTKLVVSPEQASILVQMLTQALQKYTETNGQLRHAGKAHQVQATFPSDNK